MTNRPVSCEDHLGQSIRATNETIQREVGQVTIKEVQQINLRIAKIMRFA